MHRKKGVLYGVHLADKNGEELKERFEIICKNQDKKTGRNQKRKYMVYFFLMIVLSYTVVIQPAYDPPEDEIITEEGMEELTPDNTYVQKEGDKYYMIYKNDKDEISKEDAEEMKMSGFEVKENEER